eukprot:CAMPEP_0170374946 /NCGR_PEP_ID=MMETSP0117_2-20130122/10893_1 /TAXON_ID=400756 /ORGANISM="Durinskia baltica, Strain CSIRO CS-38" /LENGTH=173 /DNA_ID=CAMNT_0010629977 /DNA_START=183 /DNA_END=702 /DNA_ORIENTATION=+
MTELPTCRCRCRLGSELRHEKVVELGDLREPAASSHISASTIGSLPGMVMMPAMRTSASPAFVPTTSTKAPPATSAGNASGKFVTFKLPPSVVVSTRSCPGESAERRPPTRTAAPMPTWANNLWLTRLPTGKAAISVAPTTSGASTSMATIAFVGGGCQEEERTSASLEARFE